MPEDIKSLSQIKRIQTTNPESLLKTIQLLEEKLKIAAEVLEYYRMANYGQHISQETIESFALRIYTDRGSRAREALKKIGEGP